MQQSDWIDRRAALDPTIYKTKDYVLNIQCAAALYGKGGNAITIDNTPFVLDLITHGLFAVVDDDQDGDYTLQFRDDQTVYNSQPAMSQQLYGGVFRGNRPIVPPIRMFFQASSTLNIDVVNYIDRTAGGTIDFFTVQMVFKGFERWDQAKE